MCFRNTGVTGNGVHTATGSTDFVSDLIQRLLAARIDDDGSALGGKQRRCRATYPDDAPMMIATLLSSSFMSLTSVQWRPRDREMTRPQPPDS